MGWLDDLSFRFRSLRQSRRREEELDEELHFHLGMEVERRVAAGENRASAERAARLAFGGVPGVKEACRDAWGTRRLEDFGRDLRAAWRQLGKARRFSLVAIASLAIGIGAAALMFSVVDTVLLRPLPFAEPERIVSFWETTPAGAQFATSEANLLDVRARSQMLTEMAAIFPAARPALEKEGTRIPLDGFVVSPSFFRVLGVQARWGRVFGVEEEQPGRVPRVVLLSDGAWRRQLGGDPQIVGQKIDLDGELWTVIGVLPPGFRFGSNPPDLYLPRTLDAAYPRGDHRLSAVARLARGVTLDQASAEVEAIATQLGEEHPGSNAGWSATLEPISETFLGPSVRRANFVLLAAVGLLLVLACVNVSNLLLARGSDRAAEMRLRLALGASRARLMAQLLTEAGVLGVLSALGGLALTLWTVPLVRGLDVPLPRLDEMSIDLRVIGFILLVALGASLLSGLVPALRITVNSEDVSLRTRSDSAERGNSQLRALLVAAEVALATMLAVGAGLLLHSFGQLQIVAPGFETSGVLLAEVELPAERYGESRDATGAFYQAFIRRVQALPGVEATGATAIHPFSGAGLSVTVAQEGERERDAFTWVQWRSVAGDYFRALHIPMLRGRGFEERAEPRPEIVISAQLADRLWPDRDPLGQQLRWLDPDGPLFEVVGVVGEIQDQRLEADPPPMVYLPHRITNWATMTLVVQVNGPLEPLIPAVRAAMAEIDPLLASPAISTLDDNRRLALARPLLSLQLMAAFALIALVLATVGVYGIVAYAVSQRRHELGLRVALGARPRQLVLLVMRRTALLLAAGLAAGLLGSLALVESLQALLYATSPFDLQVLAAVTLVLATAGLLASWAPAWRGAHADPLRALREE